MSTAMIEDIDLSEVRDIVKDLIPDNEFVPSNIEEVLELPSFVSKMKSMEMSLGCAFDAIPMDAQNILIARRLAQIVNILLLNDKWKERLGLDDNVTGEFTLEDWQNLPISDKSTVIDLYMGEREGVVVPMEKGGFEIVASGGTTSGQPIETVYSLNELSDTYEIAGKFMGNHMLSSYLDADQAQWVVTTLADYQMWSSGTMVGGVLQEIPNTNYIGAGPVNQGVYEHMMSYAGQKTIMSTSQGIAALVDLGQNLKSEDRESFRVAMYGSGLLPNRKRHELKSLYPNLDILSYFAATQAETIGLQLDVDSDVLTAIPGLHLIEIVDENGRWVEVGEEGELVVTRLHANEAPIIRYKIGDKMIRKESISTDALNAVQFEFAGRSGDMLHVMDSQHSATRTYDQLVLAFKTSGVLDLDQIVHEMQFVNYRSDKNLELLLVVDDPFALKARVDYMTGMNGVRPYFVDALIRSLSLFNQWEANHVTMDKTGYQFNLKFVDKDSEEVLRTPLGKVPLVRDVF